MMTQTLANLLKQTLDPGTRSAAEEELAKVHKIIGFAPGLLEVVMAADLEMAVRQAAVIYFKNLINQSWSEVENENVSGIPAHLQPSNIKFSVHEQDKAIIRENVVQAAVAAPDVIKIQLNVCISLIIKKDFPHKWPEVVDKISIYLQTPEAGNWSGALLVLHQLAKAYEYRKKEDRGPIYDAMRLLLPMIFDLLMKLLSDQSPEMTLVKKIILKIFFALTQFTLPMDLINKDFFTKWMEIFRQILEQDIPEGVERDVDDDDKPQLIWWKQKKWAMHILTRIFGNFGSPGNVAKEYNDFSTWYLKTFSQGILQSIFKILDAYRRGVYVSPRVLQQSLNYLNTGVSHASTWKIFKDHVLDVIKDVLFPIMCHTESDALLWENDPYEYIRIKYDIFEEFLSPVTAAQTLLYSVCKKRKHALPKTMEMLMGIVQNSASTPSQKDGALHMIGTVAEILLKKKIYKEQMEQFLVSIVFPEFNSSQGHLRARACWMLHHFSNVKYKNPAILGESFKLTIQCLLKENEEVPVKVEAAIALQMLLTSQGNIAKPYVQPQIREITLELLKIIRDTENDDLTTVLQKIVCTYTEELTPVAVDLCTHLVETFAMVLESPDASEEKAMTAMGLLNTMETILSVMEEKEEVHAALEPVILKAVHHIFTNNIMEFYEEALSMTCDLTTVKISNDMWGMLKVIYDVFEREGQDYFIDMMPTLHNYVTVDTDRFLSTPDYPMALFNMCGKILEGDELYVEERQSYAAKLLEVIILQAKGKNINELIPLFVEVSFIRLAREVKTSELRTMLLQVAIAAMYYDAELFFTVLQRKAENQDVATVIKNFVGQWITDTDCFIGLHDRKLSVLGLCQLMTMPQLPGLAEHAPKILPSLILLFDGLKHAYEAAKEEIDSDESSDEEDLDDDDLENAELSTDEDEIDDEGAAYLETLEEKVKTNANGLPGMQISTALEQEEDSEDSDDEFREEHDLENYTTPLDDEDTSVDEYQIFQQVMQGLEGQNSEWYHKLLSNLSEQDRKSLKEIFTLAQQRHAARESKNIEQSGGYRFNQQTVPGQFNFGTGAPSFSFGKQ